LRGRDDVELLPVTHGQRGAADRIGPIGQVSGFRWSYPLAACWTVASGAPFPGARKVGKEIDLYHAPDLRIPKFNAVPVIANIYDVIPLRYPQWSNPRWRGLKNLLMRRTALWADGIIAASNSAASDIAEEYRVSPQRIAMVPLGVHANWTVKIDEHARLGVLRRFGLRAGFFLGVGTLQPRKNFGRLLDAYESLPARLREERQLVLVGRAGWSCAEMEARLKSAQPGGRVRWLDYVGDEDLRAIYQSARCLVYPSLYEGFGLPVLESFAAGTPVVTSNVSALPEVAGDAAILVQPEDIEAIAGAMLLLGEDESLVEDLAARGRNRAKAYTWEACAERTRCVYGQLS